MSVTRVYLDHNATSPMRPEVMAACLEAADLRNAASVHAEGRQARRAVETARARVAALVGVDSGEVVFGSGGTEANNAVLRPGALLCPDGRPVRRLLVGAGEHSSVLFGHRFPVEATGPVRIDRHGRTDLDHLSVSLAGSDEPMLVSIQLANSETGAIQPVDEIAALARSHGAAVHVDAVQAAGRVPVDARALGIDALTVSAHKLGGPMGAGALIVAPGRAGPDLALVAGGGQEGGLRAGTQNVLALSGFGVAAAIAARELSTQAPRLRSFRDKAEALVRRLAPDAVVFAASGSRLPNTLAFAVPGLKAETALIALDLAGIAVSSGSACSSGKVGRSHVLAAMGVPADIAAGAIRVSFGWNSTADDLGRFAAAFENVLRRLYKPLRADAA